MNIVPWRECVDVTDSETTPVVILSLESEEKRRLGLVTRGIKESWVRGYWQAQDFRKVEKASIPDYIDVEGFRKVYNRDILPGEVGCLKSHCNAISWFLNETKAKHLLVLEDDIVPQCHNYLDILSDLLIYFRRVKIDRGILCHLGVIEWQAKTAFSRRVRSKYLDRIGVKVSSHIDGKRGLWLAHSYIIDRKAAKMYLERQGSSPILCDDWLRLKRKCNFELFYTDKAVFSQASSADSKIDSKNLLRTMKPEEKYNFKSKPFFRLLAKFVRGLHRVRVICVKFLYRIKLD